MALLGSASFGLRSLFLSVCDKHLDFGSVGGSDDVLLLGVLVTREGVVCSVSLMVVRELVMSLYGTSLRWLRSAPAKVQHTIVVYRGVFHRGCFIGE